MIEIPEDPQVVFDMVAEHLLKQNEKSQVSTEGNCWYRGPRGLKCAAGFLIPDDKYNSDMEQMSWLSLAEDNIVPFTNGDLITSLQIIHDIHDPKDWLNQLYELAAKLNLNTSVLIKFQLDPENNTK